MSKKTTTLVILLAFLVVLIIVCIYIKNGLGSDPSSSEETESNNTTNDFQDTTDETSLMPSDDKRFTVNPKAISERHSIEGVTLIFNSVNCPVFEEAEGYNLEKINSTLWDYCENFVKITSSDRSVVEEDYDTAIIDGFDFEPYEKAADYNLFFKENTVSIKFEAFEQSGGADNDNYIFALCFDLVSGKRLTFGDFAGKTEDEANEYISSAFEKLISENPENFFDDALELLPSVIDKYSYYLTSGGVTLFLNSSVISPNALGIQTIVIPYSELTA